MATSLTSISGATPTRPYSELDSDRYQFITLDQTEPNPGVPDSNQSIFISNIDGTRSWTKDLNLSGLSFKSGILDQVNSDTNYFLVFKHYPGSQAVNGKDDSVGWSIGAFEEQDTLQTVTARGDSTNVDINLANFTADSAFLRGGLYISGNLTVNGTETIINSTTLTVDDKNIVIAEGSPSAAAADGAGITVDGANATLTYANATDRWVFNKNLDVTNIFVDSSVTFDGSKSGLIKQTNSQDLDFRSTKFNFQNEPGGVDYLTIQSGNITLSEIVNVLDSANMQGRLYFTDVPPKAGSVQVLFVRDSDGLVMKGEVDIQALGDVGRINTQDTDSNETHHIIISPVNGGAGGTDSAYFDLNQFTYNPSTNTLGVVNVTATGFSDLDSTDVAGDLQIKSTNGRLLDSAGRSFVIYDSSGSLLWGNNGTSAGNLGGAAAALTYLNDLSDVNITSVANGDVLKWDATTSRWVNGNDLGGDSAGLGYADFSVVNNAIDSSQVSSLGYNNATGIFTFQPPAIPGLLTDLGISDGSVGQVLSTDGNGNFSFINAIADSAGATQNLFLQVAVSGQSSITATAANSVLTLAGTNGVSITTNAATKTATFSYTDPGPAPIELASRDSASVTTTNMGNGATLSNLTIKGWDTYALHKIKTSHASRVRLYVDSASRTSDLSRSVDSAAATGSGLIAEVTTAGSTTVKMSPGVIGWLESTDRNIPVTITNLSGGAATITVTLTHLRLEA